MGNDDEELEADEAPEIIPPDDRSNIPAIQADVLANINSYTDRPDLLLEVLEKYDPGFIKAMNDESKDYSKEFKESKFKFGKYQAYAGLFVSVIVALGILGALIASVITGKSGFGTIVGLSVFYAISQGGTKGFLAIIDGFKKLLSRGKNIE